MLPKTFTYIFYSKYSWSLLINILYHLKVLTLNYKIAQMSFRMLTKTTNQNSCNLYLIFLLFNIVTVCLSKKWCDLFPVTTQY